MRLTPRVSLVGSGQTGFDLTEPLDCHVYLIDGGSELALVDAGAGLDDEAILANVRAAGFDPARIGKVVLTHAHADHASGAAGIRRATGATVLAPQAAVPWIEQGDEEAISLRAARAGGIYPADYRFNPCPEVQGVAEGDRIAVGDLELRVLDTPGHAAVHCSFLLAGDDRPGLLSGDVVFHGGRILLLNTPDCSIQALAATMARLRELAFEALFPGHGPISVRRGRAHVEAAAGIFDRLSVPPSFL